MRRRRETTIAATVRRNRGPAFLALRGTLPLNSEVTALRLFTRAISGAEITLVDRYRR